ncbi:MAG: accessory Sec system translocase SecA2, partial [Acidobacteriota bacterium]|nr:accessory Sec system translocase SecA2 [Acidobacteriota bacterium]
MLDAIRARDAEMQTWSAARIQERVATLRAGTDLDALLPETFALAAEASRRVLKLIPFDVQLLAGIALHGGHIAEMQTGEGKTLAAVFPAILNALTTAGVHILTVNDYLAKRDAQWMGGIYRLLGLSVASVEQAMTAAQRKEAYAADVTYATANEVGFDYLRDHLCYQPGDLVQRPFNYLIIDEVDSILIDEARIPLVIAGGSGVPQQTLAYRMAAVAGALTLGRDHTKDEYARNVHLTERGAARAEMLLGCANLYDQENLPLLAALNNALHAKELLRRDVDYLVKAGGVELVDEFKGRVAENRRWPDGLQAAIEAKEGVGLKREGRVLGSITIQNLVELYSKISGMTATAVTQAEEFSKVYDLAIVAIPTNRPLIREDHPDVVFTHRSAKEDTLIDHVREVHATGRPVLVGTASVAESERLGRALAIAGVPNQILNARNDEQEARIVAQAGALGALTISTNMAGRGTDIVLGGNPARNRDEIVALGGLYVIGTNKHESRRIDNQLRGRAGRQGDPGSSRFLVSLEDDLAQRFGVVDLLPPRYRHCRSEEPLRDPVVQKEIDRVQRIVEGQNLEVRRTLWKYEGMLEQQRQIIHKRRREVLLGETNASLRRALLFRMDDVWSDYLVRIAELREGIHWVSLAGHDPVNEFRKGAIELFDMVLEKVEGEITETEIADAASLDTSSTWTYLINDQPLGDLTQRLMRGVRSKMLGSVQSY